MTHLGLGKLFGIGFVIGALCWGSGCATTGRSKASSGESPEDVQKAIEKVADVIVNKSKRARYCPLCGHHYSSTQEVCPVDQTKLEDVEE